MIWTLVCQLPAASSQTKPFARLPHYSSRGDDRMDCDDTMKSALGESADSRPAPEGGRVLILGGGFGGVYAALRLEKLLAWRNGLTVTLVTRDNYFLFTPMLHEVAAAEL